MKPSTLLLSLTLLANLVLATAVFLKPAASTNRSRPGTSDPDRASATHSHSPLSPSSSSISILVEPNALASTPSQNIWSGLYSEDFNQFASRLKAAGFSQREVLAITAPFIGKKFDAARAEVMGKGDSLPYWRTNAIYSMPEDQVQRAKLSEIMQKESKTYGALFSTSEALVEDEDVRRYAIRRFGNLPLEKLQQLVQIQSDYDELQWDMHMTAQARPKSELTGEEKNRLKLLESELQRDLQKTLTPEEYSEYLLRSSPTAQNLRYHLDAFRPTESEYKALFALQRPVDERFAQLPGDDETASNAHAEAMKKLEPQIQAVLGPERYADYKQALEGGNDKVARLLIRLDLPLRTATQINTVRDGITQRAETLRADPALSPAERDLHLSALAQEARTKLSNTLGGQRGLDAYTDLKGDWLRALQPKRAPFSP